jgi:AAA family ATP:ADP antiporter
VSAALFAVAAVACGRLGTFASTASAAAGPPLAASSVVAWATRLVTETRLRALVGYMLAFTITSTLLYFQQASVVRAASLPLATRTAYFARIDLVVNIASAVTQSALTARLVRRLGIGGALVAAPLLTAVSFATIALAPTLAVLATMQIARRTLEFSLARPTREILFTRGAAADRYQAKPFLDTFIYRAGDAVGASIHERLAALGASVVLSFVLATCALWAYLALWLGRDQRVGAAKTPAEASS